MTLKGRDIIIGSRKEELMHFHYVTILFTPKGLNLPPRGHKFYNSEKGFNEYNKYAFSSFQLSSGVGKIII